MLVIIDKDNLSTFVKYQNANHTIFKMKKLFFIACIISVNIAISQNQSKFSINESQEYIDEIKTDSILSIYTSNQGNTAVVRVNKKNFYYDIYNSSFNRTYSNSEKIERKERFIGDVFYNDEIKIFTESYPDKELKTVWCQTLDLKNNTIKKIQLTTAEVDKRFSLYSNTKGAKFAISPNQKYLSIVSFTVNRDKIFFHISVFNATTLDIIYEKLITRNENKFYDISDFHIDNDQNLYLLGSSYYNEDSLTSKKGDHHHHVIEKISERLHEKTDINYEDKYISKLKASMINGDYKLYGIYSDKELGNIKGAFTVSVNLKTLDFKNEKFQELPAQVYLDLYGNEKKKKKELSDFKINYILSDSEDNIYFLAEEFYKTSGSAGFAGPNGSVGGSSSTPHFDDILILKFTKEGDLAWGRSIYKRAKESNYNAFIKDDELHILLNTGKDLKTLKDGRTKTTKGFFETTALYDYNYSIKGELTIAKIQNNKNKTYYFPKFGSYVNGEFIMISKSNKSRRFMKLE